MTRSAFRRSHVALVLVLVAFSGIATAAHLGPQDVRAVHLNVLIHVDETADGGHPLALVDNVTRFEGLPRGEGGGPQTETVAAYLAAYEARVREASPAALAVDAILDGDVLRVHVQARPVAGAGDVDRPHRLEVRAFDDRVEPVGDMRSVRLVARGAPAGFVLDNLTTAWERHVELDLGVGGPADRVGVLVTLTGPLDAEGPAPVRQSATWAPGQEGPTVQRAKAVLLEVWTAADCPPCGFAEDAAAQLAREYGHGADEPQRWHYVEPGAAWRWVAAGLAGAATALWLARRARPPGAARGRRRGA